MAQDMRRAPAQPMVSQPMAPAINNGTTAMTSRSSSKLPWVVLAIIIVVLAVLGFLFRGSLFSSKDKTAEADNYQAVFLTNGQVYFGHLTNANDQYLKLTDIYYLQVSPTQGSQQNVANSAADQQGQLTLVALGNELHGPENEMKINRDQVLFFERIKKDGKVAQAILCNKKDPSGKTCGDQQQQAQSQPVNGTVGGASTGTPTKSNTNSNSNSNR